MRTRSLLALAVPLFALAAAPAADPPKIDAKEVRFEAVDDALKAAKGKVVVIDFWATWCAPCVKKFPRLVEWDVKYRDKGLVVISVSDDKAGPKGTYDKQKVLDFLTDQKATFTHFIKAEPKADDAKFVKRFGMEGGVPFLAIYGKDGKVVWNSEQEEKQPTDEALAKMIEAELARK